MLGIPLLLLVYAPLRLKIYFKKAEVWLYGAFLAIFGESPKKG
jgi:hypothetical protein